MAILFSACVSYSVMHVFVCLLEQYDVTSVFRVLLLSRMIVTSFFSFYFSSGTLLFYYFFFFQQIQIPKIEMPIKKVRRQLPGLRLHVCGRTLWTAAAVHRLPQNAQQWFNETPSTEEAPLHCTPPVRWQGEAVFLIEGKQLEENEDGSGRKISNWVEIDSTRIVCCFSAGGEGEEAK